MRERERGREREGEGDGLLDIRMCLLEQELT